MDDGVHTDDFIYDAAGRTTQFTNEKGTFQLVYNAMGRISQVLDDQGMLVAEYMYDTASRRVAKIDYTTSPEVETHYIYDINSHLVAEYEIDAMGSSDLTKEYFWAEGRLVGVLKYEYVKASLSTCSVKEILGQIKI